MALMVLTASISPAVAAPPQTVYKSAADTIARNVSASGKISERDYRTVYTGLKSETFPAQDAVAGFAALIAAKNLTQAQKTQMSRLCALLIRTPYAGDSDGDVRPRAITLLGVMHDKSAIPVLVPQLKAAEDRDRIAAQAALQSLDYKTPSLKDLLY